jgi:hypothetical protein
MSCKKGLMHPQGRTGWWATDYEPVSGSDFGYFGDTQPGSGGAAPDLNLRSACTPDKDMDAGERRGRNWPTVDFVFAVDAKKEATNCGDLRF